jgi:polyphenol oxidase
MKGPESNPPGQAHSEGSEPVVFLESPLLRGAGFRHAFFTRRGGVSPPPWDTLNFATSTGDDPAAVKENLRRAARALGVHRGRLYFLSQAHGVALRALQGDEVWDEVVQEVGDILVSAAPGVACGVRTADCVPVLIGDRRTGAVAAVHSGWRGVVQDAVGHGIAALQRLAGSRPEDLVAAVGPHIEKCCFQVGDDVARELEAASSAGSSASRPDGPGKARVDLRLVVRRQLEARGLAEATIEDVPGCTVCDRASFHSHRRDGAASGRMLSAIVAGVAGPSEAENPRE